MNFIFQEIKNYLNTSKAKVDIDKIKSEDYFIDILMYNIKVHCYVVIEVKIGKFHPKDIGQLMFYINAIDELEKSNNDNPPACFRMTF